MLANAFFIIFLLFPIVVLEPNIAEGPDRGKLGGQNALCFDESFQSSSPVSNCDEGLLTPVFIIIPVCISNLRESVGRKKGCPTGLAVTQ